MQCTQNILIARSSRCASAQNLSGCSEGSCFKVAQFLGQLIGFFFSIFGAKMYLDTVCARKSIFRIGECTVLFKFRLGGGGREGWGGVEWVEGRMTMVVTDLLLIHK